MKKIYGLLLFLFAYCVSAHATALVGTLNKPDGTGFTGTLYLSIAQQVGITSAGSCGGPVLLVPTAQIAIKISNGVLISPPNVYGGDCTLPASMPYNAILKDTNGNTMFSTQWLITGTTQDVGTVYQGPAQIPPTALTIVYGLGVPTFGTSCSASTMYVQVDAAAGTNLYPCINNNFVQQGGGAGTSVSINIPVTGGSSTAILFVDPTGKLQQDVSNFNYNTTTKMLTAKAMSAPNGFTGNLTGVASVATALAATPAACTSTQAATGVDIHGNAVGCFTPSGGSGGGVTPGGANYESQGKPPTGTVLQPLGFYGDATKSLFYHPSIDTVKNADDGNLHTANYTPCTITNIIGEGDDPQVLSYPCTHVRIRQNTRGYSRGNVGFGEEGWQVNTGYSCEILDNGDGITNCFNANGVKTGAGDMINYFYTFNYGGITAKSDEGLKGLANNSGERPGTYTGTITAVSGNTITTTATADGGYQGTSRFVMDMTQAPIMTGYSTAYTQAAGEAPFDIVVAGGSLPVSTAWGTLVHNVPTPVNLYYPYTASMTFPISVTSGSYTTSSTICFSSSTHECATISLPPTWDVGTTYLKASSVNRSGTLYYSLITNNVGYDPATSPSQWAVVPSAGAGQVNVSAQLHSSHAAGGWVMQGNGAFALDYTANQANPQGQILRYPVECIGAISATDAKCVTFIHGFNTGFWDQGNVFTNTVALSSGMVNTGGVVNLSAVSGVANSAVWLNQAQVTISGATPTQFNGLCTSVRYDGFGNIVCNQSASAGMTTTTAATLSVGSTPYGNTNFTARYIAQAISVQNQTTKAVDGTFLLEPSSIAATVGDAMEQNHFYTGGFASYTADLEVYNPTGADFKTVFDITYGGQGITGEGAINGFHPMRFTNTTSISNYIGGGGTQIPPHGFGLFGAHLEGYTADAPFPANGDFLNVRCPLTALSCADPNYVYRFAELYGNGGSLYMTFKPYTGDFTIAGRGVINIKNLQSNGVPVANIDSPAFTGSPTALDPTLTQGIATKHYTDTSISTGLASALVSPAFTGSPTAPTPTISSGIATKSYADTVAATPRDIDLAANVIYWTDTSAYQKIKRIDSTHVGFGNNLGTQLSISQDAVGGTSIETDGIHGQAPTQTTSDTSTLLATDQFVHNVVSAYAPANIPLRFVGSLSTTATTADSLTVTGLTTGNRCTAQATNAGGSTLAVYVSITTNTVTVNHAVATAGDNFDLFCNIL